MSGAQVIDPGALDILIRSLADRGYTVIGPTVDTGTIVYGPVGGVGDLPAGWTDEHDAGTYRLHRRADDALFGYVVGPRTIKSYLFPPRQVLLEAERTDHGIAFRQVEAEPVRYAFIGVRPCEIAAIDIQDAVFGSPAHGDPSYVERREGIFIVAVNCAVAGGTCFCTSMGTGPRATHGYDLVLTEVIDGDRHELVVESGSDEGAELVGMLEGRAATAADADRVASILASTAASVGRSMHEEARALLAGAFDDPVWDEVAQRCLSCTNCTLVCPTCFCSTMEDATDLLGTARRTRRWDSCFSIDFTNLHGHPVRASTRSRYRQWITHKLSSWYDQFGTSGCVGCGRCITWCPAAIDITAEVARLASAREEVQA